MFHVLCHKLLNNNSRLFGNNFLFASHIIMGVFSFTKSDSFNIYAIHKIINLYDGNSVHLYDGNSVHLYDGNSVHCRQSLLTAFVTNKCSQYLFCRYFPTLHNNMKQKAGTVNSICYMSYVGIDEV